MNAETRCYCYDVLGTIEHLCSLFLRFHGLFIISVRGYWGLLICFYTTATSDSIFLSCHVASCNGLDLLLFYHVPYLLKIPCVMSCNYVLPWLPHLMREESYQSSPPQILHFFQKSSGQFPKKSCLSTGMIFIASVTRGFFRRQITGLVTTRLAEQGTIFDGIQAPPGCAFAGIFGGWRTPWISGGFVLPWCHVIKGLNSIWDYIWLI